MNKWIILSFLGVSNLFDEKVFVAKNPKSLEIKDTATAAVNFVGAAIIVTYTMRKTYVHPTNCPWKLFFICKRMKEILQTHLN